MRVRLEILTHLLCGREKRYASIFLPNYLVGLFQFFFADMFSGLRETANMTKILGEGLSFFNVLSILFNNFPNMDLRSLAYDNPENLT